MVLPYFFAVRLSGAAPKWGSNYFELRLRSSVFFHDRVKIVEGGKMTHNLARIQ